MSAGENEMISQGLRAARFPGKYVQGKGAIGLLGQEVKNLASRPFCLIDRGIAEMLEHRVRAALGDEFQNTIEVHGGDCTWAEITAVEARAPATGSDCIVGVGGGKALDTAKAVADRLKLPCIIVPTIAASDAPCSALAIVYHEDGALDRALHLSRNPDVVIADTEIIAAAPARFLAAGIGDGLATCVEANACRNSGADNTFGFKGVALAYEIARLCEETLFEFGAQAIDECNQGQIGEATERVVEANILLSGLGFESCGVAAAHGVQDGLCELDETHASLHGEKVAIGILAELELQGADPKSVKRYRDFMQEIGLPVTLPEVGIADVHDEQLERVAVRACRAGDIIHNEPMPVTPDLVVGALRKLA